MHTFVKATKFFGVKVDVQKRSYNLEKNLTINVLVSFHLYVFMHCCHMDKSPLTTLSILCRVLSMSQRIVYFVIHILCM